MVPMVQQKTIYVSIFSGHVLLLVLPTRRDFSSCIKKIFGKGRNCQLCFCTGNQAVPHHFRLSNKSHGVLLGFKGMVNGAVLSNNHRHVCRFHIYEAKCSLQFISWLYTSFTLSFIFLYSLFCLREPRMLALQRVNMQSFWHKLLRLY